MVGTARPGIGRTATSVVLPLLRGIPGPHPPIHPPPLRRPPSSLPLGFRSSVLVVVVVVAATIVAGALRFTTHGPPSPVLRLRKVYRSRIGIIYIPSRPGELVLPPSLPIRLSVSPLPHTRPSRRVHAGGRGGLLSFFIHRLQFVPYFLYHRLLSLFVPLCHLLRLIFCTTSGCPRSSCSALVDPTLCTIAAAVSLVFVALTLLYH